ncbi:hypothetical protein BJP36_15215 [Moorena producens JHB]|uniref:Uncharacterized protein n=1 Tax=Moorena producens (strain JHB) TaxID=1454205 RepID=A0A1D9G092_MOOP1|nr:hypothetical protein [Moorena producens]AOY81052.1 hypothetical protein BJP36_15215 [Moorena producens JHB]
MITDQMVLLSLFAHPTQLPNYPTECDRTNSGRKKWSAEGSGKSKVLLIPPLLQTSTLPLVNSLTIE